MAANATTSEVTVTDPNPKPHDSVEIETMSKGPPKITVKVYDDDAGVALQKAIELFRAATTEVEDLA